MAKVAYLYDDIYLQHETGYGHPECPERLSAINYKVKMLPFYNDIIKVDKKKADFKYIELIHDRSYIDRVKTEIESGTRFLDSMDTVVSSMSFEAAIYAVGGCLNMCDVIMRGEADCGFCAVRPPGHHAERNHAAGFCIFNNIAISAKYLQKEYKIERVAIVDWDVHHGNGTQHSFESDPTIYFFSLHQYPYYPGSGAASERGEGKGKGFNLNFPMGQGSGEKEYMQAFEKSIIPELEKFKPEIILISAGFDSHEADPLALISLTSDSYYKFTKMLQGVAKKYCSNRMIAFLEGGYDLNALTDSVIRVMEAFNEG
ncbi:MAG: histone deacetylase [Spirochaetota bacterium]